MTRIRILIVLVIALLAGGGLAAGTYRYLQNVPTKEVGMPTKPVVVAATASPSNRPEDATSKVVLSNVEVLTAGTRLEQKDEGKPIQVTVVTLLVTPEESERLTLASTEGKIQLALRNPLDAESPATSGVKTSALVGTAQPQAVVQRPVMVARRPGPAPQAAPAPVPVPPPPPTIEIIRGDKKTQVVAG